MSDEKAGALVPVSVALAERLGANMHKSRLFAGIANAEGAQAIVLAGAELGIGPIAALTGIHLIKGKVSLSANLMAALIRRSGRYDYRIVEHTDTTCRIEFTDKEQSLGVSEFTWQDAERAGLVKASADSAWRSYPKAMLFARALSQGARWHCPDIFAGALYTPEELGAQVTAEGDVVQAEWTATPVPAAPASVPTKPPTTQVTLDELLTIYTAEEIMAAAGGSIPTREEACVAVAARLVMGADEDADMDAALLQTHLELAEYPAQNGQAPAHPAQLAWIARLSDGVVPDGLTRARAAVEIGRLLRAPKKGKG